jgi:peptidoglycan hydrolase-like protein with peptidoglycan-binding domain
MLISIQGCVLLASSAGGSATTIQVAQTIDVIKTTGDVGSAVVTNKTLTDHALSALSGKDCRLFNVLNKKNICKTPMPDVSTPEKIKAFQKSKNLEQTGKIGPKTRIALWRIEHELDD